MLLSDCWQQPSVGGKTLNTVSLTLNSGVRDRSLLELLQRVVTGDFIRPVESNDLSRVTFNFASVADAFSQISINTVSPDTYRGLPLRQVRV